MNFIKLAVVITAISTLVQIPGLTHAAQAADPAPAGIASAVGPTILNLRGGPGPQFPVMDGGPLMSGVGVTVLDGQLPWLKVAVRDGSSRIGWVNGYYLTVRPTRDQLAANAVRPAAPPAAPRSDIQPPAPVAAAVLPHAVAQAVQAAAVTECGGPTAPGFVTEAAVIGLSDPVYVLDHGKACANERVDPCHVSASCSLDIFANPTGNGYQAVLLTLVRNYKGTRQVDGQTLIYVTRNADACNAPDGHDCLEALRFDGKKMVPLRITEK